MRGLEHYQAYMSIKSIVNSKVTIKQLNTKIDKKFEELQLVLLTPKKTQEELLIVFWEIDILKLIVNKKEYDKMNKEDKDKKLKSYKRALKNHSKKWIEGIETSFHLPTLDEMFEFVSGVRDITSFAGGWVRDESLYWMHIMPLNVRQAFYMVALIDYDCKIYSEY